MTEPMLISLPAGTERRGLHLTPPHGHLIWDGRKTAIAKAKPFDLSGPWILVSGGKAYGTIEVGEPEVVSAREFDGRFHTHRVTRSERMKWWSDSQELYLSPILRFDQFDEPLDIQVVPGMQTVVEEVNFVGDEPAGLDEYCKGVSERLYIIGEFMEQMDKQTPEEVPMETEEKIIITDMASLPDGEMVELPDGSGAFVGEVGLEPEQATVPEAPMPNAMDMLKSRIHQSFTVVADDMLAWGYVAEPERIQLSHAISTAMDAFSRELGAVASEGTTLGERLLRTGLDGTHAVLMATKEEESMPYSIDKPPDRISGLPAAAQRIWIRAYNAAHSKYDGDEERSNKIAWGAVKNSGYYQDEEDNWHKKELPDEEEETVEEVKEQVAAAIPVTQEECCPKVVEPALAVSERGGNRLMAWLKGKFEGVLDDLRGIEDEPAPPFDTRFKTFVAHDGKQWLLTWTTNAFEDREGEIFRTKALEEYVERHEKDEKKGEFWFWHMPGAKFADIHWQATVGRFLVEGGPFDDTPIGRKFAAFFAVHPHDHPELAPEGWGTSHGYHYLSGDRKDAVYEWFEKFETTVLPKSAASNQHSPRMEVLPMNQQQQNALTAIGGADLVKMVMDTGEEHTKELEQQGVAFKATEAETLEQKALPQEDGGSEVVETSVDSGAKGTEEIVQQIVAALNLGDLLAAVKQQTDGVASMGEKIDGIDARLKALEDMGVDQEAPLAMMWPKTALQASKAAQTVTEDAAQNQQPHMPTAIAEMAQRIPL